MTLVDRVNVEFASTINHWGGALIAVEPFLQDIAPDRRKALVEKHGRMKKSVGHVIDKYQAQNGSADFNLETFAQLNKAFETLEQHLPSTSELETLVEAVNESLDKTPSGRIFRGMQKLLPYTTFVNAVSTAGTIMLGAPLAAATYAVGLAAGIREEVSKSSLKNFVVANVGTLLGHYALGMEAQGSVEKGSPEAYATVGLVMLGTTTLPFITHSLRYVANSSSHRTAKRDLRQAKVSLDAFLKRGVVIKEARRNLKYVRKVTARENIEPSFFQDDLRRVEETLLAYIDGNATREELIESRITYVKPASTLTTAVATPAPVKNRYTPEEYASLKQTARSERPALRKRRTQASEQTVSVEEQDEIRVTLGRNLKTQYDRGRRQLDGMNIVPALDLAMSKLEADLSYGTVIRSSTPGGRALRRSILADNGLPKDAPLFKMNPTGALRAIYVRDGNAVEILDLLTHKEYDTLMRNS